MNLFSSKKGDENELLDQLETHTAKFTKNVAPVEAPLTQTTKGKIL